MKEEKPPHTTTESKRCPSCSRTQENHDSPKCEFCGHDFVLAKPQQVSGSDKIRKRDEGLDSDEDPPAVRERDSDRKRRSVSSGRSRRSRRSSHHRSRETRKSRRDRSRRTRSRRSRREEPVLPDAATAAAAASGWEPYSAYQSGYPAAEYSEIDAETLATMDASDVNTMLQQSFLQGMEYQSTITAPMRTKRIRKNKVKIIDLDNLGNEEKKCVIS